MWKPEGGQGVIRIQPRDPDFTVGGCPWVCLKECREGKECPTLALELHPLAAAESPHEGPHVRPFGAGAVAVAVALAHTADCCAGPQV